MYVRSLRQQQQISRQIRFASRLRTNHRPPFPVLSSCPSPTCPCAETPSGLDIDRSTPLNGTAPAYSEHLLLSTGHADWPSKLEDDIEDAAIGGFKTLFGRDGKYVDPYHKILITNSSLQPSPPPAPNTTNTTSAYLFPSFKYIPRLPTDPESLETFSRAFLLPSKKQQGTSQSSNTGPIRPHQRIPELQSHFEGVRDVDEILVLICGHGNRDSRCGILGPILQREFSEKLASAGVHVSSDAEAGTSPAAAAAAAAASRLRDNETGIRARVGLVSHVGGHKFAGNVIVYIPPHLRHGSETGTDITRTGNDLAGMGIWYGRVEPGHVQGLVEKSILGGRVVMDLFRGGIGRDGEVLRV